MGLQIKSTVTKPIKISGTDIELQEVYMRIEFAGRANGKVLEISPMTYSSKQTYSENKPLFTDVQTTNYVVELLPTESQSIETALDYTKVVYERLGYEVVIETI